MMPRIYLSQAATLSRRAALSLALGTALWLPLSITAADAAPKTALTLGMAVEPAGLDPTIAAPVAIGQVTWQNIFEGLVTIDREGKVRPQLAESWEISLMARPTPSSCARASPSMTARLSIPLSPNFRWIGRVAKALSIRRSASSPPSTVSRPRMPQRWC